MSTGRRWVAEVADGLLEFPTALCRLAQNYVAALSRRFKSFVNVRVAQTLDSHVVTLHRGCYVSCYVAPPERRNLSACDLTQTFWRYLRHNVLPNAR